MEESVNIYFAGYEESAEQMDNRLLGVIDHRLFAYNKMAAYTYEAMYDNPYTTIMLDSGAYSVSTGKARVALEDYITYCRFHASQKKEITYYVNLDVIPQGKTKEEKTEHGKYTAEKGFENYDKLVKALAEVGVPQNRIIHVFHQYEDFSVLKRMVDELKLEYIGLSPGKSGSTAMAEWFENCAPIVLSNCAWNNSKQRLVGTPKCKLHGFGVSTWWGMLRLPWYSVDTTRLGLFAELNKILVPCGRKLKTERLWDVPLLSKWDFKYVDEVDIGNIAKRDEYWLRIDDKALAQMSDEEKKEIMFHRHIVVEYIRDLALHIGHSIFTRRPDTEVVKGEHKLAHYLAGIKEVSYQNEEPTPELIKNPIWWEKRVRYGLVHDDQWRMLVNVVTTKLFAASNIAENAAQYEETACESEEAQELLQYTEDIVTERMQARRKAKKENKKEISEIPEFKRTK
jgi:hypothetical protein